MDLGNGRRGDRPVVKRGEQRFDRLAELVGQHRARLVRRKGRQTIAQHSEVFCYLCTDQVGSRRHRLAELYEGWAQRYSRIRQTLAKPPAVRFGFDEPPQGAHQPGGGIRQRLQRVVTRQHACDDHQPPKISCCAEHARSDAPGAVQGDDAAGKLSCTDSGETSIC